MRLSFINLNLFRVSKFGSFDKAQDRFGASNFDHLNLFRISDLKLRVLFSFLAALRVNRPRYASLIGAQIVSFAPNLRGRRIIIWLNQVFIR